MARIDKIFQNILAQISKQDWEEVRRPKWSNGEPVKVKRVLSLCNDYDLSREFPLASLRPVNLKGCIREILAIYQKRSVKVRDLGNIWIPWSSYYTSDRTVYVDQVLKERKPVNELIAPLIPGEFPIGHSNNDGDFHIIEDKGTNNVHIQFINTGYETITSRYLVKNGEIKDRFKRSVCGVGYTGNSYSKDIVDFFGKYHRRWISIWAGMFNRCYDDRIYKKTTKYYCDKDIFVDESFHSCENFLRWVMANMRYDKDYLGILNIDKDYYKSNCYSADSCTLLTPEENKSLTLERWYKMDGKTFYSKRDLSFYLRSKGYKNIIKVCGGKEYARTDVFEKVEEYLINKGELTGFNPNETVDGRLIRFKLDCEKEVRGCYGDMINRPVLVSKKNDDGLFTYYNEDYGYWGFNNQTDFILWSLKHDPTSRRIMASMFDPITNNIKPLQECAFQINCSVQNGKLYMTLYQRSCDLITAFLWNTAQYAALLMMFAHDAGLKPGVFTHFIQDAHVYDRHEKQMEELLHRSLFGPIPQVTISERMADKGFYDFTPDDFEVWNYEPKEQIKFEVAI